MRLNVAACVMMCGLAAALLPGQQGIVPPSNLSGSQMELYNKLASRIYAPCCWSEPFRMHQSPAADKLRDKFGETDTNTALLRDAGYKPE